MYIMYMGQHLIVPCVVTCMKLSGAKSVLFSASKMWNAVGRDHFHMEMDRRANHIFIYGQLELNDII